ncbi:hypothetical protein CY34DRAFT_376614 [Suillus luteus UH-Slu-Lm8-n1]|uniref:Unplaced genomic scaffold CY34scaffold_249, whole genome shotgun sequence n=1 Tax=Suillus luteus UH-Slu-Lm8-n1 TaxID=930992 RepID=A0A0D0AA61_9AGAM|nr:hypothetical protein CY34DRAFT_376614 [Suillus luteus UH-Slu-Lm8-n1]
MVILMDEQFLVHSAVHRAVLRLLRNCVGDDIQEQLDGRSRVMGAAKNAVRSQPSDYELDLLNLLCILCSRIRTYRELLMIFFHDKHWYHSEPLFSVEEEDEDEDEDEDEGKNDDGETKERASPTPSQATITSASASQAAHSRKTEYEFLLFNYLLRFVHREGQIGDFARAGLLFLMDVAMSPGEPIHRLAGDEQTSAPASGLETAAVDPITDAALALAEYIVDGDFSDVLGAGLGAVYSLLPSKLEIKSPTQADPLHVSGMVLGSTGSEDETEHAELVVENNRALGIEDSSNPDFKSRLDHFLKLLEFLQDILRRNTVHDSPGESSLDASALVGTSIVHSILDAVRRSFLENILYPSILECSDLDGSAVAVMSYIDIVIRTLEPGQLSDLLVEFLVSEGNDDTSRLRPHSRMLNLSSAPPRAADRATKLHRRKSSAMVLLEMEAPESQKQSEYFTSMGRFTLKDLLLTNLRSKNQATVASALQLFQSMLSQRCHISTSGLLLVFRDANATSYPEPDMIFPDVAQTAEEDSDEEEFVYPGAEDIKPSARPQLPPLPTFVQPDITFSTHEREMGLYLTLVSRVDPSHSDDAFSTGYDHYLRDAMSSVQNHSCFHVHDDEDMGVRSKFKHRLNVNDPILSLVLESMRTFFSNSPKMNISLTGVLAELAVCPNRSIAGWLTCAVPETLASFSDPYLDADDDRDDRSIDSVIDEKFATETNILPAIRLDEHTRPVVHTIFQGLVGQLERYRQSVENFDQYLLERRQGLLFSENLTDALTLSLEPVQDTLSPNLPPSGSWDIVQAPDTHPQRPKPKPKTSALVSFLTPRKSKVTPSKAPSEPTTPPRSGGKNVAASPFAPHYQHTRDIVVEPFVAPVPHSGPWTSAQPSNWNADEDDVFSTGSQWGGHAAARSEGGGLKATQVTLSQLLDNVVVLEECIKELVAIIHARRSLGIDLVRYV